MFGPSILGMAAQQAANSAATSAAADARRDVRDVRTTTELQQWDIERLLMITEALWTLMKKEHGYTDADLIRLIAEIDARDGRIDGRVAPTPPGPCPYCGRILSRKRPTCLYCGKPALESPFNR